MTESDALFDPSFSVDTDAVLSSDPHERPVVSDTMCTLADAPGARSKPVPPHVSVPDAIEQDQPPVVSLSATDHDTPGLAGSGSVIVTCRAVPAPVFVTVITKPAWSPATTEAASAFLVIAMDAQFTVIDADAVIGGPSLDVVTVAVLSSAPHEPADAVDDTCTLADPPGGRSNVLPPQVSLPAEIEHDHPPSCVSADHAVPVSGSASVTVTCRAVPGPAFVTMIV